MAESSIISDVSMYLVRYLRGQLCPTPVASPGHIELASPGDSNPDYILGVCLYDIRKEGEVSTMPVRRLGKDKLMKVPDPYTLCYMVYLNGSSQLKVEAADAQKIIGRAIQAISDCAVIDPLALQPWLQTREPSIALHSVKLELEEKVRFWQAVEKPYQLSLFYKASPVFLSSQLVYDAPMVREADFSLEDMEYSGREEASHEQTGNI